MNSWAGFWIGCGLVVLGIGVGHIGDCIREGARLIAEAYGNTFCNDEEEENNR